jgi:hypothetical protein
MEICRERVLLLRAMFDSLDQKVPCGTQVLYPGCLQKASTEENPR